jgi:hypothetical protein
VESSAVGDKEGAKEPDCDEDQDQLKEEERKRQ